MAGYTTLERISPGPVVRAASRPAPGSPMPPPAPEDPTALAAGPAPEGGPGRRLREVIAAAREQWAMTTFYLFDPESWR